MSISFLISSERSGSNFITKLLDGHSNICGPSTKHVFNPVLRNLYRYQPLQDEKRWEELIKDIYELLRINFSVWSTSFTINSLLALAPRGDINSLLKNIFYTEAKNHGKQHIFIKENHVYEFLPYLLINYPESKYVCLVRDPRDMALSWKKNPSHPGGVVKAAKQWKVDQQNMLKTHDTLQSMSILTTYEKLITDTESELKKIIGFLGLSYEPEMLDFHKDELTQKNAKQQKAWKNLSKSVISNNKNKYREELSEQEIKYIEKICYYEMMYLGYSPEFDLSDLNKISTDGISTYEDREMKNIEVERPQGVLKNMNAKKTFYEKLFDI